MNRLPNQTLALAFAAALTIGSMNAVVTAPPAHAEVAAPLALPEIA